MFTKSGDRLFVVADQVSSDVARIIRSQVRKSRHLHGNELAVNLNLGRASGEKIKSLIFSAARNMAASKAGVATLPLPE